MNQTLLAGQEQAKAVTGRQEASKKHVEMILITQSKSKSRSYIQADQLQVRLLSGHDAGEVVRGKKHR